MPPRSPAVLAASLRPFAVRAALCAGAALLASSAAFARDDVSLWRLGPENIGPEYSHEVDDLYRLILWIVAVAFVATEALLVFFLFRFRAKPGGKAVYTHGNHRLEVVWTILPAAILFWLALHQMGTWKAIKITRPDPKQGLVVEVLAKQFEWNFRYAGPDGKFGTEDDIFSVNNLHVPVDTRVTVLIRSQDVLHAFFLPNIRLKQDAVPGLTIPQWFEARKTTETARKERGDDKFEFEIACAELCGIQHTKMRGVLKVDSKEDFWKWIDKTYVEDVLPYGSDPEAFINKHWPASENKYEDVWLRDGWPAELKAKWPKPEGEKPPEGK
jgi:cytochrome c oxidase subunit 2